MLVPINLTRQRRKWSTFLSFPAEFGQREYELWARPGDVYVRATKEQGRSIVLGIQHAIPESQSQIFEHCGFQFVVMGKVIYGTWYELVYSSNMFF